MDKVLVWLLLTFFSLFFSLAHVSLKYYNTKNILVLVAIDMFYWGCWIGWLILTGSLLYKFLNSAFTVIGKALQ